MENEVTDNTPPCKVAERYLANSEIEPVSDLLPRASARCYIPRRCIEALFADKVTGVKLEGIFLCPCHGCVQDGGPVDDRSTHFNELREKELRADYATIFALLIYVHRPGLIRVFQQHGLKLHGTEYLQECDFDRLKEKIRGQPRKETIADLASLKRRVLRDQYSFLVRTLKPYSDIKVIPAKELLPIKENETPKGKGSFAEVHCFEFQDDDYRSQEFGRITKFARKVFTNGEASSSAKEWYNLQGLSKATKHQHLMPALGAYWHGDIFFILQEEADMSLHDYLSRGQGVIYKSSELWKQVQGLAQGINTLHNLYQGTKIAYHQDLKPANILIVRGIMKIADFGLLEFKPVSLDETGSTGVVSSHNTGYYAPPRQGRYTRKDDIWSLACIISELATADIQDRDEIPKYREARIADGQRGRDTPAFFLGTHVKNQVLDKHRQLQRMIQTQDPTDQDDTTRVFQRKFYTASFFELLNSMFRHGDSSGSLLAVPGQVVIPDSGEVAETLEALRKEAMPVPLLNVQGETTGSSLQRDAGNTEDLVISMDTILSKFQDTLSQKEKERFEKVNLTNMKQFLVNLQAKQRSERRQQGLKRLSPFLEAFEQFGELFGKFCVPDTFMAFIWGPVKYMLELAQDHQEALNQIVDVYGEVGRQQPFHPQYDEPLRTQLDITQIISAGYSDITQVHSIALKIFKQRCWKDIFSTSWARCRIQISRYTSSMASRLDVIVHGGNFEQTHTAQSQFTLEYEQNPIGMDDEDLKQRQTVYTWLKPIDMENKQYHLKEIRNRCSLGAMPGRWLLDHMTFKEWFDPQFTALPTLLWLHGDPGVGKSVLASLVIEEAQNLSHKPIVLFFYFEQGNDDRDTFVSMARTLLAQLLKQDTGILDYMYNSCCKSGEPFLNSRFLIEELLLFALSNCNSAYIILDGLDECASRDQRKTIVGFFRKIIENHDGDRDADRLRCMFVSRKDSARKDFSGLADIAVDLEKNEDDIDAFCQFRSQELGENLRIPEDKLKEIASVVSAFAHGMFLVAELVWINLCGQSSIDGLEVELDSLPTDLDRLDEAYKRIMRTILNKPVKAQREEAKMLLSWLIYAKRPLKLHEVQTMKSINLAKGEVEFERRHFQVRPEDLCESLVRVRRDGSIELVHSTAKSYLLNSKDLDGTAKELDLATFCIDYLNLPIFNNPISTRAVTDGSYGFMEYAVLNWVRHLEAGLSSEPGPDESTRNFCESFETLLESHWRTPTIEPRILKRTRDKLQIFETSPQHGQIQQAVASTQEQIKRFGDMRPEECALDLAEIVASIRVQIEYVVLNGADWPTGESLDHELERKYGTHLFKCPRFSCKYFTDGFASKEERGGHVQKHERPFRCTDTPCTGFIGFAKEEQLTRHLKDIHHDHTNQDSFPTEDEIAESQREYVPETAAELEETPPAIAEVPDADVDANAELESESESESDKVAQPTQASGPANRRKTPAEFKCDHCDKTFTKRWNLVSHLTTHGVGEQFPCRICSKTLARQSDLTRHMKVHDKVKDFICGGVLRNGQSWGCKRSFLRADILSNHHKSKKGQKCIAPREEEERAPILPLQSTPHPIPAEHDVPGPNHT